MVVTGIDRIRTEAAALNWSAIPLGDLAWCDGGQAAWRQVFSDCRTQEQAAYLDDALAAVRGRRERAERRRRELWQRTWA